MNLYVIAGPNGAGKTTFAKEFLPNFAKCNEFINADLIAGGLSPFSPRSAAVEAGRFVLNRIHELASRRRTFAFETTLSGRGYLALFRNLKKRGYKIHLFYLWLPNAEIAIRRVKERVRRGGHFVPDEDVRRRFNRSLKNLFAEYLPLLDTWTLFDNSQRHPRKIAYAEEGKVQIIDTDLLRKIKNSMERS